MGIEILIFFYYENNIKSKRDICAHLMYCWRVYLKSFIIRLIDNYAVSIKRGIFYACR